MRIYNKLYIYNKNGKVIKNPELARKRLQILCMNAQTMKKRIFAKSKIVVYFPQIVKEEEE